MKLRACWRKWKALPCLVAGLLFGTGMRLMEGMRLRVKDVEFDRQVVIVSEAKGGKDQAVVVLCRRLCLGTATAKSILDSRMVALHGAPCCWMASSGWALGQGLSTAQSSKTTPRALNFFAYASLRLSALAAVLAAA